MWGVGERFMVVPIKKEENGLREVFWANLPERKLHQAEPQNYSVTTHKQLQNKVPRWEVRDICGTSLQSNDPKISVGYGNDRYGRVVNPVCPEYYRAIQRGTSTTDRIFYLRNSTEKWSKYSYLLDWMPPMIGRLSFFLGRVRIYVKAQNVRLSQRYIVGLPAKHIRLAPL